MTLRRYAVILPVLIALLAAAIFIAASGQRGRAGGRYQAGRDRHGHAQRHEGLQHGLEGLAKDSSSEQLGRLRGRLERR